MQLEGAARRWSVVLSDFIIAAVESEDGIEILVDEDALEFLVREVLPLIDRTPLICEECGEPIEGENLGQIVKDENGELRAWCLACTERRILTLIRELKAETPILVKAQRLEQEAAV